MKVLVAGLWGSVGAAAGQKKTGISRFFSGLHGKRNRRFADLLVGRVVRNNS